MSRFQVTVSPYGRRADCGLDSIHDRAQNAADLGGANPYHTNLLMGHAPDGATGHYKTRTPEKTVKVVACIFDCYGVGTLA